MPEILCGPLVRHIGRTHAVLWLELNTYANLVVELETTAGGGVFTVQAFPARVGRSWYAWIACRFLLPGTRYTYRVFATLDGTERVEQLWPDGSFWLPSEFATLPSTSYDDVRIAMGSCRGGYPQADPKARNEGPDALEGFSRRLEDSYETRETQWPHLFLHMGDQVYSDNLSRRLEEEYRITSSRMIPRPSKVIPVNFEQFAELYRESWTSSRYVRWMLSCVPSLMIFDDHDVIDDWNISAEWVAERRRSRAWVDMLTGALLAYWIYQGAGNLSPREWSGDVRMRPLVPSFGNAQVNLLPRLSRRFERYTRGIERARWSFSHEIGGTNIVVADTRMSRKLTPPRLIMDDPAWSDFVDAAKNSRSRRTLLVTPGPVLSAHPLHILLSRAAESIESDPPSAAGALAGGSVGFLIGGPAGAVVGALAGSVAGEALLDHYMNDLLEFADAELWAAFPRSLNRLLTLMEHLHVGIGTRRQSFVGVLSGDVHHSQVIRGDFLRSARPGSMYHFTMSPLRRSVNPGSLELLMALDSGHLPYRAELLLPLEKPSFVDRQFARLDWYPLDSEARRVPYADIDVWDYFGKFVGELRFDVAGLTYQYWRAVQSRGVVTLEHLLEHRVTGV